MDLEEHITTSQMFPRTNQRKYLFIKRQAVVSLVAIVFGALLWANVFESIEISFLDRWLSRPQGRAAAHIVLVPISAKSIHHIGKWPWPPSRYADILKLLSAWGARTIYIDRHFSESWSEEERAPLLDALSKIRTPVFFTADYVPRFDSPEATSEDSKKKIKLKMEWVRPPLEIVNYAAFGHRELKPEKDRVFRFWQPWIKDWQGQAYALASLKMILDLRFGFSDRVLLRSTAKEMRLIPWNQNHFENWPRVEFSDLMQNYVPASEGVPSLLSTTLFEKKDVFIGLADESNTSSGWTPWRQTVFPFEVMATIFEGLDSRDWQMRAMAPFWLSALLCMAVAGGLIYLAGKRIGYFFWLGWLGLLGFSGLVWCLFALLQVWFPFATTILFLMAASTALFVFDVIRERGERSALFHLATRDGLTNLYVIRHFRLIMNQVTREAVMRKENLSVILIDIDFFKKINDAHGHAAGDMVLKKTAEVLESCVRQKRAFKDVDFIARYGGEEFIVLVRRNSLENTANLIAERIRNAIANTHYEWQMRRILVTVSLGVAILHEGENVPDLMVHRADKALYLAKKTGRNCVCTEAM